MAFPFALIAIANLALYVADYGFDTSLVVPVSASQPSRYYLNPRADIVYGLLDLRGPEPQSFALPKPADTFRVVVVGESSVQGYPYPSELAFPRQLQLVLERQLSQKHVEVLNAGIVGISTTPLVDVVRQVLTSAPDLIVVYAGHNEFYGVGGVASNVSTAPWQFEVRRFRLAQLFHGRPPITVTAGQDLISTLPQQSSAGQSPRLEAQAREQYRHNLQTIIRICQRAQVPTLLCGVASNLRDQSPELRYLAEDPLAEITLPDQDPNDPQSLEKSLVHLREVCSQACAQTPLNAVAHYRLAQVCEALKDFEAAGAAYRTARDTDVCRYRAPGDFRDIAADLVRQAPPALVKFVDLAPVFQHATTYAVPGGDFFLEHVHFNTEGHWLVARTLGQFIVEGFQEATWSESALPSTAERDDWLGLVPEDQITAHMLAYMLIQQSPFNRSADAQRHQSELSSRIQDLIAPLTAEERRRLQSLPNATKVDDLIDGLGRDLLQSGAPAVALAYFERGERRRPWLANSHIFAAVCLEQLGQIDAATAALRRADQASLPPLPTLLQVRQQVEAKLSRSTKAPRP
ncbi:MAG: SGNH/GDSL hydrolase family protein [Planctomycetes bacterium]|nr:SGNH/GDSL hydrolase family protein [Planctomycetota bacterium]